MTICDRFLVVRFCLLVFAESSGPLLLFVDSSQRQRSSASPHGWFARKFMNHIWTPGSYELAWLYHLKQGRERKFIWAGGFRCGSRTFMWTCHVSDWIVGIRGRHVGVGKKKGEERTPLPKRGFGRPLCLVRFPPPSGVIALFFLHKKSTIDQTRSSFLFWMGSRNFREGAFSGTFSSPRTFCTPPYLRSKKLESRNASRKLPPDLCSSTLPLKNITYIERFSGNQLSVHYIIHVIHIASRNCTGITNFSV